MNVPDRALRELKTSKGIWKRYTRHFVAMRENFRPLNPVALFSTAAVVVVEPTAWSSTECWPRRWPTSLRCLLSTARPKSCMLQLSPLPWRHARDARLSFASQIIWRVSRCRVRPCLVHVIGHRRENTLSPFYASEIRCRLLMRPSALYLATK